MTRNINEELQQIRQLRDSGALSEDEFRRAKAAILGDVSEPDSGNGGSQDTAGRVKRSGTRAGQPSGKKRDQRGPRDNRSSGKGMYRDNGNLVVVEGAVFLGRCVICNKESDRDVVVCTFKREQKSHYIEVAAVQTLARAAGDLLTGSRYTGPVQAPIPMCSWHRNRRLRRIGFGFATMLLAVVYLLIRYWIVGGHELSALQIPISSIFVIIAAIVGLIVASAALANPTGVWFRATKYYDRLVWLQGAGREFLRTLPGIEEYHYKPGKDNPNLDADELIRHGE
jgi:hypothetical protein